MKKLKLFITALALLGGVNLAYAQTDVTSTYLSDFSSPTGWTNYSGGGNEHSEGFGLIGTLNLNSKPSTTDATHLATEYCCGFSARWNGRYTYYQQTAKNLLAGKWTLKYDVQDVNSSSTKYNMDNYFYVKIGDNTIIDPSTEWMNAGASSWTEHSISFKLTETSNIIISLGYGNKENKGSSDCPAIYVSHLKLEYTPFATPEDYQDLNAAISTVESKAWGFDAGEYAPYNYVEVLAALAEAKAIDQEANNSQVTVQQLTSTLNNALNSATWTANTEEVNAIFDGSFEYDYSGQTGNNVQPLGWYRVKGTTDDGYNVRYASTGSFAGVAYTSSDHGLFTKLQAYYGWGDGYTMPLNENTYYTVSFVTGGAGDCDDLTNNIDIINPSEETTRIKTFEVPNKTANTDVTSSSWITVQQIFKTGAAGNYVLGLVPRNSGNKTQNQFLYGDFLLKATTLAEATGYYNTVLDEVDDSYDADANGGTEKTAFKDAIDAGIEGMTVAQIMEAAANLYTLRDAFLASTPKYDLYLAEKVNAERIDASITSSITAPTTADGADAALKAILVGEFNYVKDNFNADAAATYGITIDQWTGTATSGGNSDTPQTNSGEKWGNAATTYYEQGSNGWGSSNWTLNYTKTVTLPANKYVLKVAARASEGVTATLKATIGETTIEETLPNVGNTGKGITTDGEASFDEGTFANEDNGYGWQWRYLAFTLEEEGEVTLQIDAFANSAQQWCSFGDVAVVSNVTTEDMETAYNNFTMQTLGFEQGQYAPYNNVTILEAYAQAKAIVEGETVPSTQTEVDAITATLTSPSWTANTGDVDAIYNGTFAETGTGNNPKGWTRSNNGWGQQITGLTAEANGVSDGTTTAWYYNNNGAWQYGNDGVYTMPLAANTSYKLTFKYAKHNSDGHQWMKASVISSSDNNVKALSEVQFPGSTDNTMYTTVAAYFTTENAGNYILSIEQNGNVHLTDVSLVKAESAVYALSETATSAPSEMAYYETVTLTRTLSSSYWNTFSVPFDMAIPDGWTVKEFDSADDEEKVINFKDATEIKAGVPYLVKPTANAVNPTFSGVLVKATEGETMGTGDYKFAAQIYNKSLATDGTIAYLATDGYIKKLNSATGLKGLRAYFIIPAGSNPGNARIAFTDGDQTGIKDSFVEATNDNRVYDLQGRQVKAVKKGIYVVNGKKVIK